MTVMKGNLFYTHRSLEIRAQQTMQSHTGKHQSWSGGKGVGREGGARAFTVVSAGRNTRDRIRRFRNG